MERAECHLYDWVQSSLWSLVSPLWDDLLHFKALRPEFLHKLGILLG